MVLNRWLPYTSLHACQYWQPHRHLQTNWQLLSHTHYQEQHCSMFGAPTLKGRQPSKGRRWLPPSPLLGLLGQQRLAERVALSLLASRLLPVIHLAAADRLLPAERRKPRGAPRALPLHSLPGGASSSSGAVHAEPARPPCPLYDACCQVLGGCGEVAEVAWGRVGLSARRDGG